MVRIAGKDHYLGKHGSPESWERYHRLLAERAQGVETPPRAEVHAPALTVAEMVLAC